MVRNEMIRGRQGRLGGFALVGLLVVVSATVCLSGASALPNEHRCPADDDHKIDMARKLREENNPSFAIICYEEALEHGSTTSDALLGIAEILFELGNYSGAEARLHDLLNAEPKNAAANFLKGNIHRVRHHTSIHAAGKAVGEIEMVGEVVHYYKKALELNPTDDIIYAALGSYYMSVGDFDLSVLTYQEGLEKVEDSAHLLLGMAETYKYKEEYETCLNFCQRAITTNFKLAGAYGILGECALFANQSRRSVHALQKACQIDPHNPHYLHLLITAMRSATEMDPNDILSVMSSIELDKHHDPHLLREFHDLRKQISHELNSGKGEL